MEIFNKVLITGSGGFLGTHLSNHLAEKKIRPILLNHNKEKESDKQRIQGNIKTLSKIPSDVSHIVHLAALTDVDYCQNNPQECFDTNVMGTQNMLELARKSDLKFLFASSSQVFGFPKKLPISENAELNPLSIHGLSKASGEILCKTYADLYELDITIMRLFSIYGPGSPSYSIVGKTVRQIFENNKVILGDLTPKRDFLYVSDLMSAMELLLTKNLKGFSKYNIGSGKSISIYDLCNKLIEFANKPILIEENKKLFRKTKIPDLICDNSKIKKLGWEPKITLNTGLRKTFDWFKKS